jgi:hypothetical protein
LLAIPLFLIALASVASGLESAGANAHIISGFYGTTKVVPCYKTTSPEEVNT